MLHDIFSVGKKLNNENINKIFNTTVIIIIVFFEIRKGNSL